MHELATSISIALLGTSCLLWARVALRSHREVVILRLIDKQRVRPGSSAAARFAPDGAAVFAAFAVFFVLPAALLPLLPQAGPPQVSRLAAASLATGISIAAIVALHPLISNDATPIPIMGDKKIVEIVQAGTRAFLLSIAPIALVLAATHSLRTEETQHSLLRLISSSHTPGVLGLVVMAAVVMAPLGEELLFRVLLQSSLEQFYSPRIAIAVSSIAFCAVHGFPDSLALIPLAVVLGMTWYRTRSYWTIVFVHAVFNGVNILLTLLGMTANTKAVLLW